MSSSEEHNALKSVLTPIHPDDSKNFKELQISKAGLSGLQVDAKDSSGAKYFIDVSLYTPSKKDITIYAGKDSHGKVLGDVDLKTFSGHYTIELGDPNVGAVLLEELERVQGWSSKHRFQFTRGSKGRETFVWRHRGANLNENRDDLELVVEDEEREEEEEEILAQYEAKGGEHGWRSKGRMLVREGGGEQWDLMVILTVIALIVSRRREQ